MVVRQVREVDWHTVQDAYDAAPSWAQDLFDEFVWQIETEENPPAATIAGSMHTFMLRSPDQSQWGDYAVVYQIDESERRVRVILLR